MVGARDFLLEVHIPSYSVGTKGAFFPRSKARCEAGHSHCVVPLLRISEAVPVLPIYAFMACTGPALP